MASDIKANYSGKATLVPAAFFVQEKAKELLSDVAVLEPGDEVRSTPVPAFDAVLVYTGKDEKLPEMYSVLEALSQMAEVDKHGKDAPSAVASYRMHVLTLAVRMGEKLLFCNMFDVPDFTSVEYHVFNVLTSLGLNVQKTVLQFISPLSGEQKEALKKYFLEVNFSR